MDLKKLRELAEAIRAQTVWEASPGIVVKLMDCSDGILALLDAVKNYGLDADHARQERDAMQAENETLRARSVRHHDRGIDPGRVSAADGTG